MKHGMATRPAASWALTACVLFLNLSLAGCGGGGGGGGGGGDSATIAGGQAASISNNGNGNTAATTTTTIAQADPTGDIPNFASPPVTSGTITANLTTSHIVGVAPLSIFFDATGTSSTQTAKPFHDLEYRWNFGDINSGTWSVGSRVNVSRNLALGPVASHVFETPGVYKVTMTATDGTSVNNPSNTVQITVLDPDVVFAANTICFSTSGNFSGCPVGAATQSISDFSTAINSNQTSKKRMLFRRGETWTTTSVPRIITNGPGTVGAFGTGASPKFIAAPSGAGLIFSSQATPAIKDWRAMDIEIDGQNNAGGVGYDGGINQTLLLRVNIHNILTGIGASDSLLDYDNTHGYPGHKIWDQMSIVDSRVNTVNNGVKTSGVVGVYVSASRFTLMGSIIDPVGGGEHALRNPYIGKGVISSNYIARPSTEKHTWQLHAPNMTGNGVYAAGTYTEKVVASDNTFLDTQSAWLVYVGPQSVGTAYDERLRDIIFERNYFNGLSGQSLIVRGGVSSTTIRNNILNQTLWILDGQSGLPAVDDLLIDHNTLFSAATSTSSFDGIQIFLTPTRVTYENNLVYAPNAAFVRVFVDSSGIATAKNNSTDIQGKSVSPQFSSVPTSSSTQLSITDLKYTSGSYAFGAGVITSTKSDFQLTPLSNTSIDIGAVSAH